MWLSKKNASAAENSGAQLGVVTIGGTDIGAYADFEQRGIRLFGPWGYFWKPRAGQELLIVKCRDGQLAAAGTDNGNLPGELDSGDICITNGSASVILKGDGSIKLVGSVNVEGSLEVNGTSIA